MKHNWEYKQFTDIATSVTPRIKVDKSDYLLEGPVPIISQEESYISGYWDNLDDITPHNGPVIIFGDHSRVLKYVDCDFVVGADGVKIISPKDCICAKFLFHFLKWYNIPSLGYSRHFKLIKDATFPVPSIETQMQIVAELDKINETIEDCRELLCNLDALAQSLFYDFFGDPISNSKVWNISKVSDNFITGSGGTPSKKIDEYWNSNDIPWIGSNMCQNKVLYETDGKFISTLGLNNSSAKLLYEDTILVALVGATIGKVALLKTNTSTNQNIGFIKPNKDVANPIFLFYLFQGLYPLFTGIGDGKFKMANLSFIRNLPIILPPLELQEKFAELIEQIEEQKKDVESTIAELQTLLDSRMDYWFN